MSETEQTARWEGVQGRECGEHRTLGGRAWCFDCSEYCYPSSPCRGCKLPQLRKKVEDLEARAALADLLRPCFIVNNGWVVELSMPHTVMDEFVRRYDALDQGAQEERS